MSKSIILSLLFIVFLGSRAHSQTTRFRGSLKGVVADTTGRQPMPDATVSVTPERDTSDAQFAITDKHGAFIFKGLEPGKYHLIITFEGYRHRRSNFVIDALNLDLDFGTMLMQRAPDILAEIVVQRPPMQIKKDTIEYNAESFATKPNAVAEDQLKKLPGVQVDASGNITAQGEKVTRVLVNGKRFFGNDPKLATRNIPPEIIEKYQIFDDLDDQSKFSGFDDGNRIKTINIITRRDRRQGYFGRLIAGAGTDQTYNESVAVHDFHNDRQVSVLEEGNDINKQIFTVQDVLGSSGSRRGSGGGPTAAANPTAAGITTIWAGGANYRDTWGKYDAYGSYFYNFTHVSTNTSSLTQKFFNSTDTSNTTTAANPAISRSTNQRINFNIENKSDSGNSFVFRPNITWQHTSPNSSSTNSTVDQNGDPVSSSVGNSNSSNQGYNINGSNLTLRHKFKKPSRTISLDVTGTVNVNDGSGYYNSANNFYKLDSFQNLRQFYNDSLHSVNIAPTLSYTEPISKHSIIEVNYNHTYNRSRTINNTYDYNAGAKEYDEFDSLFSNSYRFLSNSDRISLSYRLQQSKLNVNIGGGVQFMNFDSRNTTKNIDVSHNFVNLTPTINFTYSFTNRQRLRFYYTGRTGTPSASQLQPLTTTNDDINYTVGNPALKPQFTHSMRMLYSSYNPSTQNVIFATINASTTVNDIQSEIIPNDKGGQTTTYVNLNGTWSVAGYFDYGFSLKKPKSNLNLISNINYSQSQTLVDSMKIPGNFQHDYTRNTGLSETVSWTTNIKKNFDMNLSSAANYTIARNSLRPSTNFDYFSEVVNAEFTAYTNSGWLVAADFTYTYSDNHTPGYNASIPLLSPSIAKQFFSKKQGELRLTCFDILNQNTMVSKNVSLNQVSDSRTTTLTRYVMLTFTYNLNNFGQNRQRRGPGNMPPGGRFRGGNGGFGGGRRGPGG